MPKLAFTTRALESLTPPAAAPGGGTRQAIHYDTEQPGLALRITSGGARVFVVDTWSNGRSYRVRLGAMAKLSIAEARRLARIELGKIAGGTDTNAQRRADRVRGITLREAAEAYIKTRARVKRIAARTEFDYRRLFFGTKDAARGRRENGYLSAWLDTPLTSITKEMVARRHEEIGARSPAQANYAMRALRAVFNYARATYEATPSEPVIAENPVELLSQTRAWYRVDRRQTLIKVHELRAWFTAVLALESDARNGLAGTVRDYLLFLLLTGLRRGEAAHLTWDRVDLEARTFTIADPKNHQPHTLPLSDYLQALLAARPRSGPFVFPGPGKTGHLVEPKKQIAKVRAASGVEFSLHDLRRTFVTIAESLDIPAYALKKLLNHAMRQDVTAGYLIIDVERLRRPMQQITDYVLAAAGVRPGAEVKALPDTRAA